MSSSSSATTWELPIRYSMGRVWSAISKLLTVLFLGSFILFLSSTTLEQFTTTAYDWMRIQFIAVVAAVVVILFLQQRLQVKDSIALHPDRIEFAHEQLVVPAKTIAALQLQLVDQENQSFRQWFQQMKSGRDHEIHLRLIDERELKANVRLRSSEDAQALQALGQRLPYLQVNMAV